MGDQYDVIVGVGDITGDGKNDLVERDTAGNPYRNDGNGEGLLQWPHEDLRRLEGLQGDLLTATFTRSPPIRPNFRPGTPDTRSASGSPPAMLG
ncbi:hypothetical protein [Streptomyces sp. NPDC001292]|uniref:hypothetical protein n=1 Tax=Streptomyces sp. NPDC001292 TaxID=3364558 RepID=UPI0036A9017D